MRSASTFSPVSLQERPGWWCQLPAYHRFLGMTDLHRQKSLPVKLSSATSQQSPTASRRTLRSVPQYSPAGSRSPEGSRSPLSPMRPLSPAGSSQSLRSRRRGSEPVRKPSFDDMRDERRRRSRQSQRISSSMYNDDEKIRRAWKKKYMLLGLLVWAVTVLLGRLLYLNYSASKDH